MSYENQLLISKKAFKELKSLPENDRKLIKDRISKLSFFPLIRLDVKKLKGISERLQAESWRIQSYI